MFGKNEIIGRKWFGDNGAKEDNLLVTSMFTTIQGEGPYRGEPAFFIRLAKCNLNCHFCFIGPTLVTMADGSEKAIKDVEIGEEVLTYKEGEWVGRKVLNVMQRESNDLMKFTASTAGYKVRHFYVTPDHPFYTINRGMVPVSELINGDVLLQVDGGQSHPMFLRELEKHEQSRIKDSKQTFTVYNLEVEDTHTYVANGILVHNCDTYFDSGDWLTFDEIETKIEDTIETFYQNQGIIRPEWTRSGQDQYDTGYVGRNEDGNLVPIVSTKIKKKKMVLVLTGGEPMLQTNLGPFLKRMSHIFEKTQIESNGTQYQEIPHDTTLVVSPKCLEKNGKSVKYLAPNQKVLDRADCLKFVMEADPESPYSTIPDWAFEWREKTGKEIFISPMNIYNEEPQAAKELRATKNDVTMDERSTVEEIISFWTPGLLNLEENQKNHEYVARFCITHGCTMQVQIHLLASLA